MDKEKFYYGTKPNPSHGWTRSTYISVSTAVGDYSDWRPLVVKFQSEQDDLSLSK